MPTARQLSHRALFLSVIGLIIAASGTAAAGNTVVPWMTGYFSSPFGFFVFLPDYNNPLANLSFSPTVGPVTWNWNCDPYQCMGVGTALITGGSVIGQMTIDSAVFSGAIGGGTFQDFQIIDLGSGNTIDNQLYDYTFAGSWTNGWTTFGGANADIESQGRPDSSYNLTTYSPEPGTLALAASALVGVYLRRRPRP